MTYTRWFSPGFTAMLLLSLLGVALGMQTPASAADADLMLFGTSAVTPPTAGTPTYVTFTVMNMGPDAATGVRIKTTLPPELSVYPLPTDLPYNAGTREWTVGTVEMGQAINVRVGYLPALEGPTALNAEVSASDATDPNSTPNNGVDTEDDYAPLWPEIGAATTQPDLTIGRLGAGDDIGKAVYEYDGAEQVNTTQLLTGTAPVTWVLTLTNQSTTEDIIAFTGLGEMSGWTVAYGDVTAGPSVDITTEVTGGGASFTLASGASATVHAVATPPLGARPTPLEFPFTATSTTDVSRVDLVRGVIDLQPYVGMDAAIIDSATSTQIGGSVYNETGDGQTVVYETTGSAKVSYTAEIHNTGVVTDSYLITGPASSNGWTVKYLYQSVNITAQVTGAGYTVPDIPAGTQADIIIEVTPTTQARGAGKDVLLLARSVLDGSFSDAVGAQTTRAVVVGVDAYLLDSAFNYVGSGVINTTGEDQTQGQTVPLGTTATYTYWISNTGNVADDILITAPAPPVGWTVRIKNGSVDLSAAAFGAGATLANVPAGGIKTLTIEVTPDTAYGDDVLSLLVTAGSVTDGGYMDTVRTLTTALAVRKIDASLRLGASGPYVGAGVYSATGAGQTLTAGIAPGATQTYQFRVKNEGNLPQAMVIKVPAQAGWTITTKTVPNSTDITAAAKSASGWTSADLAPNATLSISVDIAPDSALAGASVLDELITATPAGGQGPTEGTRITLTLATVHGLDATVRNEGLPTKIGEGILNTTGVGQEATGVAGRGIPVSFIIDVKNTGNIDETVRLNANGSGSNWTVTYRNLLASQDITSVVTATAGTTLTIPRGASGIFRVSLTPNSAVPINTVRTATFIARSTVDGAVIDTVKASATRAIVRQADLMVRTLAETAYSGDNIYDPSGDAETKTLGIPHAMPAVYRVLLQNDSDTTESMRVTGTGSAPGWQVRYFDSPTGGYEITSLITSTNGWTLANRSARATREIRVEVTPDRSAPLNSTHTVLVSAIVLANPGAVDTVKLATTRLPLTSVAHTASVPTVVVGHPVTLTAIPYGGDTVEYRFEAFYKDAANKSVWFVLRQYSKDATFIWTPALAKDWTVVVYAREVGTTGRHTVYKTTRVNVTPS